MNDQPTEPLEPVADAAPPVDDDLREARIAEPAPVAEAAPTTRISARTEIPFGLVFFLLLSLVVVLFTVQNTQSVDLRFLAWEGEFPLAVVIIAVVAATVLLDEVLGLFLRRRRRRRASERAELKRLRELNR